jgi:hypothetical protein
MGGSWQWYPRARPLGIARKRTSEHARDTKVTAPEEFKPPKLRHVRAWWMLSVAVIDYQLEDTVNSWFRRAKNHFT